MCRCAGNFKFILSIDITTLQEIRKIGTSEDKEGHMIRPKVWRLLSYTVRKRAIKKKRFTILRYYGIKSRRGNFTRVSSME